MSESFETWIDTQGKLIVRFLLAAYFGWVAIDVFPKDIFGMAYQDLTDDHTVNIFCALWAAIFAFILLVKRTS